MIADEWHYRLFGQEFGPVSLDILQRSIRSGELSEDDEIRASGTSSWFKVREFEAHYGAASRPPANGIQLLFGTDDGRGAEPRSGSDPLLTTVDDWYCESHTVGRGPHTFDSLLNYARRRLLTPDDRIRLGSKGAWRRAGSIGRLMAVMPFISPDSVSSAALQLDSAEGELELHGVKFSLTPAPPPAVFAKAPQVEDEWYALLSGLTCGPMPLADLIAWAKAGRIQPHDSVKMGREASWTVASIVPGLIPPATVAVSPQAVAQPVSSPIAQPTPPPGLSDRETPKPQPVKAKPAPAPMPAPPTLKLDLAEPKALDQKPLDLDNNYNMGASFSPPKPAWSPPKPPAKPARAKSSPKSSGAAGGGIGALLGDVRILGACGGLVVIVLAIVGWNLLPEGVAKFQEPYQQLQTICDQLDAKYKEKPTEAAWKEACAAQKPKIEALEKQILAFKSGHVVNGQLINAAVALKGAVNAANTEVLESRLKQASRNLKDAGKVLGK